MARENGNALFLILIAVVLFAALSYAVTQSSRGGGAGIDSEKRELVAAQILQYATAMSNAVQRMQIIGGCSDTDISFENSFVSGYAHSPAVSDRCKVFHPDGGGMSYTVPDNSWLDPSSAAATAFPGVGALLGEWFVTDRVCVDGIGTGVTNACAIDGSAADQDLVLILPWVDVDLCMAINDGLGIANPGGTPPNETGTTFLNGKFTGTYLDGGPLGGGELATGTWSVCFEHTSLPASPGGGYHFYHVLIAR